MFVERNTGKGECMKSLRNVVITAIALKRYELRHHKFPATLDELTRRIC